jgi:hypothetical protein
MFKRDKKRKNQEKVVKFFYKEIAVFENFKIKNGVLGLDRDCYLNLVKFLDSSTVREV